MRANEFVTEAHHYRMITQKMGPWTVHIDSHAFVTVADRGIGLADVVNILSFACFNVPELKTIPRGKGAYFQDTNTLISLYIKRSDHYPNELTLETVLSPDMRPTPPLFRRSVPAHTIQEPANVTAGQANMQKRIQAVGRDAVSQDVESMMPAVNAKINQPQAAEPPAALNREQRRAWAKYLQKNKDIKGALE